MVEKIVRWPDSREETSVGAPDGRIVPGVVFVPCALCSRPIDLGKLADPAPPRLCEHHFTPVDRG